MTLLTPRRPTAFRTKAVTAKATERASTQIRARSAAGTGLADRRGATQPWGRPGSTPGAGPRPDAGPGPGVGAAPVADPGPVTGTSSVAGPASSTGGPVAAAAPADAPNLRRPARRAERASRVPAPGGAPSRGAGGAAGRDGGRPAHPSGMLRVR